MNLPIEWKEVLKEYLGTQNARDLYNRVDSEYSNNNICPPREKLFSTFHACKPNDVSVVILGQDPYFNKGQATGMAFSIDPTCKCKFPPSLRNIITEIKSEFGHCAVENGDLSKWAEQGVLLLNTCLTVKQGEPLSHADIGWDSFTRAVMSCLNNMDRPIVFVLWGGHAKRYRDLVTGKHHLVLTSAHPSPLSAHNGFFGCDHFKMINNFLLGLEKSGIVW